MQAFKNNPDLKAKVLGYATARAQELVDDENGGFRQRQGLFWSQGWCPASYVCAKEGKCKHHFYADELGLPVAVAYAERSLFLDLPMSAARNWWKNFIQAIPVGVDLEAARVWNQLALYVLADKQHGLVNYAGAPEQIAAIQRVIALYEENSTDAEAWELAADEAILASRSDYNGTRMEAEEARKHAGCEACDAAHYFARCFADQRYANEAINRSGWCVRYKVYADYMSRQSNPRDKVPVDDRGMVNVGQALYASMEWVGISEKGDHAGEDARREHYERVAGVFLRLIKDSNGVSTATRFMRGLVARFTGS